MGAVEGLVEAELGAAGDDVAAMLDEALDETVLALRDYADAWSERLRLVPNHADNWDLAHVVEFSSDDQLKVWLRGQ